MNKKILLLGGSYGQIPAIEEANRRGLYTILCDYLPDNPGRKLTDEFHLVSTTDKEKVLEVAMERKIDFIIAYASDPAALTAAYVAEKLGITGNSLQSVERLTNKQAFREFLVSHQFNTPDFQIYSTKNFCEIKEIGISLPVVIKPVDSSDSKGVRILHETAQLREIAEESASYSRINTVIAEEFIDADVANFHGDGFVVDGNLVFCLLGDYLYTSEANPLKPSSTLYPSRKKDSIVRAVRDEVARAILLSGFQNGPVNIEARINSKYDIYIMEIGPRSGGSYTPETIYHSSGFNMLTALFDLYLTGEVNIPVLQSNPAICFTLHSNSSGILKEISIDKDLRPFLVEKHFYVKPGEPVKSYEEAGSSLGAMVFKFELQKQADEHLEEFYQKVVGGVRLMEAE